MRHNHWLVILERRFIMTIIRLHPQRRQPTRRRIRKRNPFYVILNIFCLCHLLHLHPFVHNALGFGIQSLFQRKRTILISQTTNNVLTIEKIKNYKQSIKVFSTNSESDDGDGFSDMESDEWIMIGFFIWKISAFCQRLAFSFEN